MSKRSNYVCVRLGTEVNRLVRSAAEELVRSGKGKYVPRSVWKEEVRDAGKSSEVTQKTGKGKGNLKGKSRKED